MALFFNDDDLDFDFCVDLIMNNFGHRLQEDGALAWEVHDWGNGIAGLFSKEVAETKVKKLQQIAKSKELPLPCRFGVD